VFKNIEILETNGNNITAKLFYVLNGVEITSVAIGNGPIDACFNAVKKLIKQKFSLEEFLVQTLTRGSDDLGKVHVQLEYHGNMYYGFGANIDIITASVEALVDALAKVV
jgi:2-isopropylmalate synthase